MMFTEEGVDYASAPMHLVWQEDLQWIEDRKQCLEEDGRLCKSTGLEILAEFQFKGCYPAVLNQLNSLIKYVKENPYTESDRLSVIERRSRYDDYWLYKEDSYSNLIHSSIREHRLKDKDNLSSVECDELVSSHIKHIADIMVAKSSRDANLHDKKECVCYCND